MQKINSNYCHRCCFWTLKNKYSSIVTVDIINPKAAASETVRMSDYCWLISHHERWRINCPLCSRGDSQDQTPGFLSPWRSTMSSSSPRSRWRPPGIPRRPPPRPRGAGHWSSGVGGGQGHVLLQMNPFGCSTCFHFRRLAALLNDNIWDDGQETRRVLRSDKWNLTRREMQNIDVTWWCSDSDLGEGCGFDSSQGTFWVEFAFK